MKFGRDLVNDWMNYRG